MTSFLDIASKQCELDLHRIGHICESAMDTFNIRITDLVGQPKYMSEHFDIDDSVFESVCISVYESESNSVVAKIKAGIDKIIEIIVEFFGKISDSIKKFFNKDAEDKLEALTKSDYDKKAKVNIYKCDKKQATLNEYIKELVILERKLMNLKFDVGVNGKDTKKSAAAIIAANEIMRELDKLDAKYDKEFLDDNKDIIAMASEDAIRFSDKELKNVKVDFEAVEKNAKEVLKEFKKDADGCDVPVKLNILQRMSKSLSTAVRKQAKKSTEYKHRNLVAVLALAGTTAAVGYYVTHPDKVGEHIDAAKKALTKEGRAELKEKIKDATTNPRKSPADKKHDEIMGALADIADTVRGNKN